MAHCCVPLCSSNWRRHNKEVSFHRFPQSPGMKEMWIQQIRREEGPLFKVTPYTVVCSKHFKSGDFKFTPTRRKVLFSGVVPTIFAWTRQDSVPEVEKDSKIRKRTRQLNREQLPRKPTEIIPAADREVICWADVVALSKDHNYALLNHIVDGGVVARDSTVGEIFELDELDLELMPIVESEDSQANLIELEIEVITMLNDALMSKQSAS